MMAKTPSLNASIREVGILPTLKSLCISSKSFVLLRGAVANNIIAQEPVGVATCPEKIVFSVQILVAWLGVTPIRLSYIAHRSENADVR